MKIHAIRHGTLALLLPLTVLVAPSPTKAQQAGIMVGATPPAAMVETLDGHTTHLSDLTAGKPALLEFWATWCPLCKALEPALKAAQAKHGNEIVFVSVGVNQNQTAEQQQAYVKGRMLGGHFVFDRDGEAVKAFQVPHTSFVVVLSPAGNVVYTGVGADQDIEAALARLTMAPGRDERD